MDIVRNYLHLIKNEFYVGDERHFSAALPSH